MQGDPRYPLNLPMSSTIHPLICHQLQPYTTCRMARPSKFVTNYIQHHRLTHFLAIPLVTPTSRSQVGDSFKCLWDDLIAIGVPISAIRPPGLLNLNLDILLRLDTPERTAKAKEILQEVSIEEALPTIHGSSTSDRLYKRPSMALLKSVKDTNYSIAPTSVSISGLFCGPGREAKTHGLSTLSYDATHRVSNLRLRLAHAYRAAGLSPKPRHPHGHPAQPALQDILGSCDTTVCLVKTPRSGKVMPSEWDPGRFKCLALPPFDARGLLERYKDHVWMENAPLDRVSICKLGLQKVETGKLPEVFSVPLS